MKIFLVQDTVQWLNCVLHDLNMEIKWKFVKKLLYNFVVHSNDIPCRKRWRVGIDYVWGEAKLIFKEKLSEVMRIYEISFRFQQYSKNNNARVGIPSYSSIAPSILPIGNFTALFSIFSPI